MKKYLSLFFLLCLFVVLILAKETQLIASDVWQTFLLFILPSLAPAMILDYLFLYSDGLQLLSLKGTISCEYPIIFLGVISGTPTLLTYVDQAIEEKRLSIKQGQRIIDCFTMPSLPFLVSILLVGNTYLPVKWWIFSTTLALNLFFYLWKKPKSAKETTNNLPTNQHENMLKDAFFMTGKSLLTICGTMLLFSLPLLLFHHLFSDFWSLSLLGIFEFSYSLVHLKTYATATAYLSIAFIIGFGSLSLFIQAKTLCKNIDIKKTIKKRFAIALINVLGTAIFLFVMQLI